MRGYILFPLFDLFQYFHVLQNENTAKKVKGFHCISNTLSNKVKATCRSLSKYYIRCHNAYKSILLEFYIFTYLFGTSLRFKKKVGGGENIHSGKYNVSTYVCVYSH